MRAGSRPWSPRGRRRLLWSQQTELLPTRSIPLLFCASSEVFGEKAFCGCVELQTVLGPGETVAFILEEEIFVVYALLFHSCDYLFRLGLFYAWVVGSLGYEHRYPDAVYEEERGAALQEVLFGFGIADPLVEGREERLPVRRDAVYQGDQARRTHDIDGAPEEVRGERGPRERGVTAVGTTVDGDPLGIGHATLDGPPDRVNQVLVHRAAPLFVSRVQELLAVPRRPPIIDLQTRVPSVCEPLRLGIIAPPVTHPGTTVYVQDHGQGSAGISWRERQVALYGEAVAGGERDGLHPGEGVLSEVGSGVEEMLAAFVVAVVGVVRGASFVGGEGHEPALVRPVAARHAEVSAAKAVYDLEVSRYIVVEHDPLRPRALDGGGLGLVGVWMG